jgi:hypothetical protein
MLQVELVLVIHLKQHALYTFGSYITASVLTHFSSHHFSGNIFHMLININFNYGSQKLINKPLH